MSRLGGERQWVAIGALLVAATAGAYWRVLGSGFVFDDKLYIVSNPHVQSGLNWADVRWAFTSWYASNWHPLTWLSHMLDYQIWRLNPLGHHLTGLLLHIANVALLFHVLRRTTGYMWRSAFVAALFALHPLHVESVAWVAERKDVLSTLFWLLTMLAYARYAESPGTRRYLCVVVLFALGLTCKPMLVSLPIVLLLMDYWPLRRTIPLLKLMVEKIPLLLLSAGSCVVTYLAQRASGSVAVSEFPFSIRAANAAVSSVAYLWKMIAPIRLAAFYPHPGPALPMWQVIGSVVILVGITSLAIVLARRKPYIAVGWFWYLVTLLPVIGLVQVGSQAMADRYTYVPLVGVFIALTWAVGQVGHVRLLGPLALALLVGCAVGTWNQTGYWKDDVTLCRRALAATSGSATMHNNLGVALYERGDLDVAIAEYRRGLRISTSFADLHINLGNALCDKGKLDEATMEYEKAIKLDRRNPEVYNNLGTVLEQQKRIDDAIEAYRQAIEIEPGLSAPHVNLARALAQIGRLDEAVTEYRAALDIEPDDARAHLNLGEALMGLGSGDEAVSEFSQALWIEPDLPEAHLNMGVMMINQGKPDEAIGHYLEALRLRPEYAEAHHNLAIALYSKGDYVGAWKHIALCRKYGLAPHPEFLKELGKLMPEPR